MSRAPRFIPLVIVAVGGVLAVRAAAGMAGMPELMQGARAWAEEAAPAAAKLAKTVKGAKPAAGDKAGSAANGPDGKSLASADPTAQAPLPADLSLKLTPPPTPPACAPTAAELARQAGMSPSELQVLQNLGARRGQLDQREKDIDVQMALLAAAEAKLDAKLKTMNGLKGDIQGLIGQAEAQKQAEQDRLVRVYETMKPKDSAARMTLLADEVRLPIAAKMKERALSAMLAQMAPADAKALTEKLANRMAAAEAARQALTNPPPAPVAAAPTATAEAAAKPQKRAQAPAPAKSKAKAAQAKAEPAKADAAAPAPKAG